MARNEEKAQSMLNRFLALKNEEKKKPRMRRPYLASQCRDLADADKWRAQILREIGRKVTEIQNPGLGEARLRDLNDEINKLIREKGHWEQRIVQLGGQNYGRAKITDADGNEMEAPSGRGPGYRYFGAAKQLPGVKELFRKPPESKKRKSRYEMYKNIDADYYGYRDDEDGVLEEVERKAEKKMRADAFAEWQKIELVKSEAKKSIQSGQVAVVMSNSAVEAVRDAVDEEEEERFSEQHLQVREFVAHVPLPDNKLIEQMVLEKRKMDLISRYASDEIIGEQSEAKEMLNIRR